MSDGVAREQAWEGWFKSHQGGHHRARGFDYQPFVDGYDAGARSVPAPAWEAGYAAGYAAGHEDGSGATLERVVAYLRRGGPHDPGWGFADDIEAGLAADEPLEPRPERSS